MTRAPASASRTVQSGAATACSIETTRSPSRGRSVSDIALDPGPGKNAGLQPLVRPVIFRVMEEEPRRSVDLSKMLAIGIQIGLASLRADPAQHVSRECRQHVHTA